MFKFVRNAVAGVQVKFGHAVEELCASSTVERFRVRHQLYKSILEPQIDMVQGSTTVRLTVAGTVAGLAITGHPVAAVTGAAVWYGAKPIASAAAAGCAGISEIDRVLNGLAKANTVTTP